MSELNERIKALPQSREVNYEQECEMVQEYSDIAFTGIDQVFICTTDDLKALVLENERLDKWRIALESLTAQGSEFHNDLDACLDYIAKRRTHDENHRKALHKENKLLRKGVEMRWIPVSERLPSVDGAKEWKKEQSGAFISPELEDYVAKLMADYAMEVLARSGYFDGRDHKGE